MSSFKLLTLNIAHGRGLAPYQGFVSEKGLARNLDRIARVLLAESPDIVALQEIDEDSHWNGRINLLDQLRRRAHYPHAWMGVHNRRQGKKPLAYGNALLSKAQIRETHIHPFGEKSLGEKGFTFGKIQLPQRPMGVINLHLDYRSRKRRVHQVEQVIRYIDEQPWSLDRHAPIICGDFNTHAKSNQDAVRHLFNWLNKRHPYRLLPEAGHTFPAPAPMRTLDFILVPFPLQTLRCEVLKVQISDHRPVVVELAL